MNKFKKPLNSGHIFTIIPLLLVARKHICNKFLNRKMRLEATY